MMHDAEMVDIDVDPHPQHIAVEVIEYLREKLYDMQVVFSEVNRGVNRYEVMLQKVPKPFWDEVLKPELKRIANRYNYGFAYSITCTTWKCFRFEMTSRR